MIEDRPAQRGFLNKTIRMKWVLLLLGIVILTGLGFWVAKARECDRVARQDAARLMSFASRSADNLAVTIATVGNRAVVDGRWTDLQQYSDKLVRNKPLSYIAIVDSRGVARVHTDRKFLGSRFTPPEDTPGLIEASSPVMDQTRQVGTVYIGMNEP